MVFSGEGQNANCPLSDSENAVIQYQLTPGSIHFKLYGGSFRGRDHCPLPVLVIGSINGPFHFIALVNNPA